MNRPRIILDPVFPTASETGAIELLDKALAAARENRVGEKASAKLVTVGGEALAVPEPLYQLLCQATGLMAAGRAVSLVPIDRNLTLSEAAALLNVSQQFMIKLLEDGAIKYRQIGSEQQIRLEDLMAGL